MAGALFAAPGPMVTLQPDLFKFPIGVRVSLLEGVVCAHAQEAEPHWTAGRESGRKRAGNEPLRLDGKFCHFFRRVGLFRVGLNHPWKPVKATPMRTGPE